MYPSQTSLIPTLVSLVQHIKDSGFLGNYPFWYLDTTPTKFLVGPIIPFIEILVKNLFLNVSYFDITIYLIILSYILGIVGWLKLLKRFSVLHATFYMLLFVALPWRMFSALALAEPTLIIARNLLPFVLWAFYKNKKYLSVFFLSVLLLINTSVLPIFLIGLLSIFASCSFKNIKIPIYHILYTLVAVTVWYTPNYWWTLFANPGIGGASGGKVILYILTAVRNFVPVFLALIAVWYKGKKYTKYEKFVYTWVFSFLFLTIFRFLSDWDYWMDWSYWFYELEIGLILLFTLNKKFALSFLIPFYLVWRIHLTLGSPEILSKNPPEIVKNLETVSSIVGSDRVFLSGSSVFWADGITQVRGGNDRVSVNKEWPKAAYEFREGKGLVESKTWIEKLGIDYVLVHGPDSLEYYHDFKNITKWDKLGKKVWEENGDMLFKLD